MIQIKYKQIFDIEFEHSFYRSGKSSDLLLVPTPDCRRVINSLGLKYLQTEFGGKVFARVSTVGLTDIIKNPIPEGTRFTFVIQLKRGSFENFTALNLLKPRDSHYYFSNQLNNISASGNPLLIADTAGKVVSDMDLLPFVSNCFAYVHASTAAEQNGELRFIDTDESFHQSLTNTNNLFNFSFDLAKTPSGRAKLFIEGVEKAFVYVIDSVIRPELFGIAEIFYRNSLPDEYQFQKTGNTIETRFYKIVFTNRATKWRYIITKKFNPDVTSVKVAKTNGSPISFTAQPGAPAGQFVVASSVPVPLHEDPVRGIKLSDQADNIIIPNLPNPVLNSIRTEGPDTFSDILITI
ncbi:hypothetical protein [Rubrolithibacter danxiaensis]|uniref:hypothetical protein n=1 Tax=Rubrolithibacter danxiaensis TaxID=3390805 RepID=UPI003BF8CB45